ncbi:MAG TPA: ATP-binding protein [Desulfatiglandales bacterium]|nr:ATP-binding protein [Desulfatiglandales bacterium]
MKKGTKKSLDFEKLGVFYLGRLYDLKTRKGREDLFLYDSKDLVTHAVCVGMTGSGKTGLCISLLEEAAIDGIPAIVIDPKGDLGNLMLTFPDLKAENFAPWINLDEAKRKGISPEEYARQQAALWQQGLAGWGQDKERIRRFREAVDIAIYTPGSAAGLPVSVLSSFAKPQAIEDADVLQEYVTNTTTSLLSLLGIQADPIRSKEHILIANILSTVWAKGQGLDMPGLIQLIQNPPLTKVGVFDLESFYPSKERYELAMSLNNLLASPGFQTWMEGDPFDIGRFLYTPEGKPRIAIFSIAHLNDHERMFFVSFLLNQVLGWMRKLPGTTSLRAMVYMDEIFGYFPPVANPPSKQPLLTLLKQGRAFGIGLVLATQNPVDLDYKGLSNAGTWFIGRLQTERDKERVLEGLEGAAAGTGKGFGRSDMDKIIAGLGNRVFLVNNVHDDRPEVFATRWALSYLAGPLTRNQIKRLMDPVKQPPAPLAPEPTPAVQEEKKEVGKFQVRQPALPPEIPQYFVPVRGRQPSGGSLMYLPAVFGEGSVRFSDVKKGFESMRNVLILTPVEDAAIPVNWDQGEEVGLAGKDLESAPLGNAEFGELPAVATKGKSYEEWRKDFGAWLYRAQSLEAFHSPGLRVFSQPNESEGEFRIRLQQASREQRDQLVEGLRKKYAPKIAALQERIRRAEQAVSRESEQVKQQGVQTVISIGATILGAFLGRKTVSTSTLGRATTAARGAGRVLKERQDVGRAQENVEALQQQLVELEAEFKAEAEAAELPGAESIQTITIKPTKQSISVKLVVLAWAPWWRTSTGERIPAWK